MSGNVITNVAVVVNDICFYLPRPYRHHHVLWAIHAKYPEWSKGYNHQGFLDNVKNYLNRTEAFVVAEKSGQLLPDVKVIPGVLYSENVWLGGGTIDVPETLGKMVQEQPSDKTTKYIQAKCSYHTHCVLCNTNIKDRSLFSIHRGSVFEEYFNA